MRKLLLVAIALMMIASMALAQNGSNLDEFMDHYEFVWDASDHPDGSPYASIVFTDRIALMHYRYYRVRTLTGSLIAQQSIPTELTGIVDMAYDGEYIYGVNQYGQESRVYRWEPEDITTFELVSDQGSYYQGIAIDPATKDIYVINQVPATIEKYTLNDENVYRRTNLGVPGIYYPTGIAWLPDAPGGKNLVILHKDGEANPGSEITMVDPTSISSHSATYTIYPYNEEDESGEPLGISVTNLYNPEHFLIATTIMGHGVDLYDGGENTGTGSLLVYVNDGLRQQFIEGATVSVENSAGEVVASGTSDANGEFFVEEMNVGIKTVTVNAEGFTELVTEGVVVNDDTEYVTANMLPPYGGYQLNGGSGDWMFITSVGDEHEFTTSDGVFAYTLEEPFEYYGTEYSTIYIGLNGVISFDEVTAISDTPSDIPTEDTFNNFIAPLWYNYSTDGSVYTYYVESDNDTRIHWAVDGCSFQLRLSHSGNYITVYYVSGTFPADGYVAGLENPDGTNGLVYNYTVDGDRQWGAGYVANDVDDTQISIVPSEYLTVTTYPNPFNPTATALVSLPQSGQMNVVLYNMLGQEVVSLANGFFQAGTHQLLIDGSNLTSGTYFLQVNAAEKYNTTRRITLVK